MPELPEVEVLVRALRPLIVGARIRRIQVFRPRVIRPHTVEDFQRRLGGAKFTRLERLGKYLLFHWVGAGDDREQLLIGHLGMTGRMYVGSTTSPLPRHVAVLFDFEVDKLVFEDTRYFGRFTFDSAAVSRLGPEPLGPGFTAAYFRNALARSRQPIKVKLLDQALVAGVGNIYASEALFRAGISPRLPASALNARQVSNLRVAIRRVLSQAIRFGSTVPLNFSGKDARDSLFYYGSDPAGLRSYEERLCVYDRAGAPCPRCKTVVRRLLQAGRSTYFCPVCQRKRALKRRSDSV